MNSQEKSALLLKVQGWTYEPEEDFETKETTYYWRSPNYSERHKRYLLMPNLYDLEHIKLAWEALTWASSSGQFSQWPIGKTVSPHKRFSEWWAKAFLWEDDLVDAQQAWLDELVKQVTEAGMAVLEGVE